MDFISLLRIRCFFKRLHAFRPISTCSNGTTPQNLFSWNAEISNYARQGLQLEALNSFRRLISQTMLRPDEFTFPGALKSCDLPLEGKSLHVWTIKLGYLLNLHVSTSLLHAYCRVGLIDHARKLFDEMPERDLPCWNALIGGFCLNGLAAEALYILEEMLRRDVGIDHFTVTSVLPVCAPIGNLPMVLSIHALIIKHGFHDDIFVSNALIDAYGKFCHLAAARQLFDEMPKRDLVSWNSIISSYEQTGDPISALELYEKLRVSGIFPDVLTLVSLASAVSQIGDSRNGKSIHGFFIRNSLDSSRVLFACNAFMDMYGKLDNMDYALKLFEEMPERDLISWNTLISGYAQNGLASEAIRIFHTMEHEVAARSQGTIVAILPAYAHVGSLHHGMRIHGLSNRLGFHSDVFVCTCLIDMYAKCGRLKDALSLFLEEPRKSSIPWNAIISGHAIHGYGMDAVSLFVKMEEMGVNPDHVTFISLLSACSHAGLVHEGRRWFHVMKAKYQIEPTKKHYACLVDLLGRAGDLYGAHACIRSMTMHPDASVWGALLGACRIHGNMELGELAFEKLSELDPQNVGYYVLLSNMYARERKWCGVDVVRAQVRNNGLKKTPGWTSLEFGNEVHVFFTGSFSHPRSEEIYKELRVLLEKMKGLGYVPDYGFVLQDVEEDEKEQILLSHSERLAIAFGNLSFPPRAPISIFKNLRVCGDCHTATKFISSIVEREIVVRDSTRFHHFKDGVCSCRDYW